MIWVPGHQSIPENVAADLEAKAAATEHLGAEATALPHCAQVLKSKIDRYYNSEMRSTWAGSRDRHAVLDFPWDFTPDMGWTRRLSRLDVSLVAQFLTYTFPCREWLTMCGFASDPRCRFCAEDIEDRHHIFSVCQHFAAAREHFHHQVCITLHDAAPWSIALLVQSNIVVLVGFLRHVKRAWDGQEGGTPWGFRE